MTNCSSKHGSKTLDMAALRNEILRYVQETGAFNGDQIAELHELIGIVFSPLVSRLYVGEISVTHRPGYFRWLNGKTLHYHFKPEIDIEDTFLYKHAKARQLSRDQGLDYDEREMGVVWDVLNFVFPDDERGPFTAAPPEMREYNNEWIHRIADEKEYAGKDLDVSGTFPYQCNK